MTLEEILEQVRAQSREAIAGLRRETDAEVEELLATAREEALVHHEAQIVKARESLVRLRAQELPTAKLALERQRLVMLNDLLGQVKQKALEKLAHLPAKDRRALYKRLLKSAGPLEGTLHTQAAQAEELKKLTGCKPGEPLDEPGFIIEGADQRLDLRFSTLVDAAWADHLKEVHTTLTGS